MMNRILTGCAALVFMCGIAMAEQATTPDPKSDTSSKTSSEPSASAQKSTMEKFVGSIQSVDPATMKISVKNSQGMTNDFTLTDAASVHKGKSKSSLSDVKTGDKVTVSYTGTMEAPMVQRVTINTKKSTTGASGGATGAGSGTSSTTGGSTGGSMGSDSSMQSSTSTTDGSSMGGSTGGSMGSDMETSTGTSESMPGSSKY